MTTTPIVRTARTPGQDVRPKIGTWRSDGYQIELRDTGDRTADIVCMYRAEPRKSFGHIEFDAAQNRHIIEWNRDGRLALEQYKRDYWDTKFYYTMAEWRKSS